MYSAKAYHTAEQCRFCWMCRHICPVGLKTGKEINTPRAKGLLVSMEKRGFPMEESQAEAMYECTLCGSCSADCATGYEPPVYIREGRTHAVVNNLAPQYILDMIDKIEESGNMFGENGGIKDETLKSQIESLPDRAPTLLVLGHTAALKQPAFACALISLMKKAGVSFTVLKEEPASGSELADLIGYVEEVKEQARLYAEALRESGADTIVIADPYVAETILHKYPEWGLDIGGSAVTATAYIAELVASGAFQIKPNPKRVTLHDSSRLARDLDELAPARSILQAAGADLREMFLHGKLSKCCGSELFRQYAPHLARLTAEGRWDDALRSGADLLLAEDAQALDVLASAVPETMELQDIFSFLLESVQ